MVQMCEKIDAKLAYTYSYSYSLNTDSTSSIPLQPPKPNTVAKPDTAYGQIVVSDPARRLSNPQSDIHNSIPERPPFNTVISWTSDETRRKEYAKIDRANSGFRGLVRRLVPRPFLSRNSRRDFFTGKCDGDSVRRFRMDVADTEDTDHHHPTDGSREEQQRPKTSLGFETPAEGERREEQEAAERAAEKNPAPRQEMPRRKWSCF